METDGQQGRQGWLLNHFTFPVAFTFSNTFIFTNTFMFHFLKQFYFYKYFHFLKHFHFLLKYTQWNGDEPPPPSTENVPSLQFVILNG